MGEPGSDARRDWVTTRINNLRDQLEMGVCIQLLACPRSYLHGSSEHALWLWTVPTQDADVVNSASGYSQFAPPKTKKEKADRAALQDAAGAKGFRQNSDTISAIAALRIFARPCKARKVACIFHFECPHCNESWLTKRATVGLHTCLPIREEFLPLLSAHIAEKTEHTSFGLGEEEDDVEYASSGVTRCNLPSTFQWEHGKRLSNEDEMWQEKKASKKSKNRHVKPSSPLWKRVMDDRGRISARCVKRTRLNYPFQLLSIPSPRQQLLAIDDAGVHELSDFLFSHPMDSDAGTDRAKAWVVTFQADSEADKAAYAEEQTVAIDKQQQGVENPVEFSLEDIRQAFQERIDLELLRPYYYDYERKVDLLIEETNTQAEASTSNVTDS